MMELAPGFAERVRSARRESRFIGSADPARVRPQALRPWLGAGRRRRLSQEPDHRDGNHRRISRRGAGCRGIG
jgi:hypothetical protein